MVPKHIANMNMYITWSSS